jgi:hypothetical protein
MDFDALELDGFASALLNAEQILRQECLEHIAVIHQALHDRGREEVPMTVEKRVQLIKFVCSQSGLHQAMDYLKPEMSAPLCEAFWRLQSEQMKNVMGDLPKLAAAMLPRWKAGREQRLNQMLDANTPEAPADSRRGARL